MAAARNLSLNLVTILRIQGFIQSMRQEVLSSPSTAATNVPAQVKYVLKSLDMRGTVEQASKAVPGSQREEARTHGIEAFEYLSQIVEFSGYDELKRPGVGRLGALSTPERLDFARKCLDAGGRELDAFLSSFDTQLVAEARQLLDLYFPAEEGGSDTTTISTTTL